MSGVMDPFDFLYSTDDRDRAIFGDLYKPEHSKFEYGVPMTIVTLPKTNDDGQDVIITETRMPARFYTAHVAAQPKRTFEGLGTVLGKPAVVLSTGSGDGCGELILQIAKAIAGGMLGVRFEKEI